jgi:hypothetical protein
MSPGIMTMSGRDETEEGIDKKLAVHYYARWKFLHDLLPALVKANNAGEEGAVMSVMAAGKGGHIDLEDLAMKNGYSVGRAALIAPTYNDLMMEVSSRCLVASWGSLSPLLTRFFAVLLGTSPQHQIHSCLSRSSAHLPPRFFFLLGGSCLRHPLTPSDSPIFCLGGGMRRVYVERHIQDRN